MHALDLSFDTPEENLACDEALLETCVAGESPLGVIRFWESPRPFAVVGFGGKVREDVFLDNCRADDIPVLRRVSGGGSVLQGPGCLNVSLVLPIDPGSPLSTVHGTNAHILDRNARALREEFAAGIAARGLSDLALGDLKVSGSAQRRKRDWLLFHATLLYDFDLPRIDRALPMPRRQPDYRKNRPHQEFVTNSGFHRAAIRSALLHAWNAELNGALPTALVNRMARLVATQYGRPDWNHRL